MNSFHTHTIMPTTRFSLVLFFLLAITLTEACIAQKPIRSFKLDEQHMVLLLDSTDAAKAILYDPSDGFFDKVTPVEMSIQMKEPLDSVRSRDKMLASYRQFLQTDVEDFSVAESKMVAKTIKAMFPVTQSFANNVFPDTLVLIKTKARHYGPGVYYTRHNSIVIPADALAADDEAGFTQTMYHELSHVYTRLNPEKKKALYALIGFEPIGYEMLDLPATLAARVLHNPDGVDFAQGIRLKTQEGSSITAIPIIFANENGFTKKKRMFFGYLEFSLFEVQPLRNGHWKVVTREDGLHPTLNMRNVPDFYRQIKDNTGYIIHPDEIIADNFSFIMTAKAETRSLNNFSAEGRQLLDSIQQVISEK